MAVQLLCDSCSTAQYSAALVSAARAHMCMHRLALQRARVQGLRGMRLRPGVPCLLQG